MRVEASVTSLSWIPSEAVRGPLRLPFDLGIGSYDDPPPDTLEDVAAIARDERFRFAQRLSAWIEVDDGGRVSDHGQEGQSWISPTHLRFGPLRLPLSPGPFPDLEPEPEVGAGSVRFRRSAGGRSGAPAPRRVAQPPYVQVVPPVAWTTLELTLHADGQVLPRLAGASSFPRHWVYGRGGELIAKSGTIDFARWSREQAPESSPWGDLDVDVRTTEPETALERELSTAIMRGGRRPKIRRLAAGDILVRQGEPGEELFLLLDGVLEAVVGDEAVAELGPGVVVGERAALEGGRRTATLRALTPVTVAVAPPGAVDAHDLEVLSRGHRREE